MDRKHIYIVNSSVDLLNILRELLQDESYNVTTTNFVPETFDHISAIKPDLLVIDLALHSRAGWDLLERVHGEALTHGTPVIVLSTEPELLERARSESARSGGQRFMGKPFDIDDVLAAVEELIGSA